MSHPQPGQWPPSLRPQKHSLTLHGHRTSVSLEPEFWTAFLHMARDRGMAINALAAEVDALRSASDMGLATAIRLAVLRHLQDRLDPAVPQGQTENVPAENAPTENVLTEHAQAETEPAEARRP